jgi:hypothetical protein
MCPVLQTGEIIGESGGSFYPSMAKSRYDSVSLYIGNKGFFKVTPLPRPSKQGD